MQKKGDSGTGGLLRIGEAARRLSLTTRTLRFYEELGLLQPQRSPRGTRLYREGDLKRLEAIQSLVRLDVPLATACALAQARPASATGDEASRKVATLLDELHGRIEEKIRACQDALAQVKAARRVVEACFGCNRPPSVEGCHGCPVARRRHESRIFDLVWEQD